MGTEFQLVKQEGGGESGTQQWAGTSVPLNMHLKMTNMANSSSVNFTAVNSTHVFGGLLQEIGHLMKRPWAHHSGRRVGHYLVKQAEKPEGTELSRGPSATWRESHQCSGMDHRPWTSCGDFRLQLWMHWFCGLPRKDQLGPYLCIDHGREPRPMVPGELPSACCPPGIGPPQEAEQTQTGPPHTEGVREGLSRKSM